MEQSGSGSAERARKSSARGGYSATGKARRFAELYADYVGSSLAAQRSASAAWQEAYGQFLRRVIELKNDTQARNADAYSQFLARANEVSGEPNALRGVQDAYLSGIEASQRTSDEAAERYQQATSELATAWREIQDSARRRWFDGYRTYLRGIQDEWTSLDVDSLAQAYGINGG